MSPLRLFLIFLSQAVSPAREPTPFTLDDVYFNMQITGLNKSYKLK